MDHATRADIETRIEHVREAPADEGTLEMIVSRPAEDARLVLERGELTFEAGLDGDDWRKRSSGTPNEASQLTLMPSRYLDIIAGGRDRWPLAGDQLYVDLDLSTGNLPAGARLGIGSAVIEITEIPHTGCSKFSRRFGLDALRFANSDTGKDLRLRGAYARVVQEGSVRPGDPIFKL